MKRLRGLRNRVIKSTLKAEGEVCTWQILRMVELVEQAEARNAIACAAFARPS